MTEEIGRVFAHYTHDKLIGRFLSQNKHNSKTLNRTWDANWFIFTILECLPIPSCYHSMTILCHDMFEASGVMALFVTGRGVRAWVGGRTGAGVAIACGFG